VRWAILGLGLVMLMGCQEKLTSPADCPALCPGGEPQVFDEVISPIIGSDTSFTGYVQPSAAAALLSSNGLDGGEERAIVRFNRRGDSISVRDTLRAYTIDSVALGFTILARDTLLSGLQLLLYRLPSTIDSTTTFAGIDPAFVPENLIATIDVPDSVNTGPVQTMLRGADLARVAMTPADSGQLSVGVRVAAPVPTGVRLGAIATPGTAAGFTTYVTADIPDTGVAKLRTFPLTAAFDSYVTQNPVVSDSTLLLVGGEPASRALIRFVLPPRIRDSATVVRATLELTPVTPISGLPTDPVRLEARAVLADLGAKSPVNSTGGRVPVDTVLPGTATPVALEAVKLVELWLRSTRPTALVVSLAQTLPDLEAASFSRPVFYSSRAADPAVRPRLRISYLLSFPFENP
jgi:hypothetical protein